jgi:hypothetical protein
LLEVRFQRLLNPPLGCHKRTARASPVGQGRSFAVIRLGDKNKKSLLTPHSRNLCGKSLNALGPKIYQAALVFLSHSGCIDCSLQLLKWL